MVNFLTLFSQFNVVLVFKHLAIIAHSEKYLGIIALEKCEVHYTKVNIAFAL